MEYQVTQSKTKKAKISPVTHLAIITFQKLVKAESRVEKLVEELAGLVKQIPAEDMKAYVDITSELEKKRG